MIKLCEGASITAAANDCAASGANASTLSMAYNALDQLLSASRTGTNPANEIYAYDDQGRRISKTSGGVQTNNLYNGDAIHSQWVTSPSNTPTAVMVHGAGIDEPLMRLSGTTNTPNATARFYMTDGLGSVIGQVDENGTNAQSQRFDAWGSANNATNPSGINTSPPYGFTGREPDGTGLIHYRARNYLPGLGIFTSRDPAGMVDAVSPYAYVGNRPTMFVDPSGMYATGSLGMSGGTSKNATPSFSMVSAQPPSQQSLSNLGGQGEPVQVACAPVCIGLGPLVVGGVAAIGTAMAANSSSDGLMSRIGAGIQSLLSNDSPEKVFVTYTRTNAETGQVYAGRTSGYADPQSLANARAAAPDQSRLAGLGFGPAVVDNSSTNSDAIRGREQMLIDQNGGAQSVGGTSANRIQGIADLNPRGFVYQNAAIRTFGNLPDNSPARYRLGR
jgi:RHS repeat-associated protein